jgi:PEP-CTERM motif
MRFTTLKHRLIAAGMVSLVLRFSAATVHAAITTFNDGAVHNIAGDFVSQIEILDGPGNAPTTVNVQSGTVGAGLTDSTVNVRNNSIFTMSGGTLGDELFLFNNAHADLTGGFITDDITLADASTLTITFVTGNDDVETSGTSHTIVNGGNFDEDIEANGFSIVDINGGTFQTAVDGNDRANVQANNNAVVNLHGGVFGSNTSATGAKGGIVSLLDSQVNIFTGADISRQPNGLIASGNGVINVFGFTGGQPASLNASGNGKINIMDGPLTNLDARGTGISLFGTDGSLNNIVAEDSAVLTIYGTNFKALFGTVTLPYGPISLSSGNISGTLADGTSITNVPFSRVLGTGTRGAMVLAAPVPEPGAMALFGIGLLSITAMRRNRVA